MQGKLKWILCVLCGIAITIVSVQAQTVRTPDLVLVQGGTFMMGTNKGITDEAPPHKVTLSDYYIGKFEVTRAEFKRFVDATGYVTDAEKPPAERAKQGLPSRNVNNGSWRTYANGKALPAADSSKPVGNVSWNDAMAYCKWLSEQTGKTFSLPTEAEWEFAARGGTKSKGFEYAGSNKVDEVAWYRDNASATLHNVGSKMANELGIYDMTGNAREWCADWYGENYYKTSPEYSPTGPDRGTYRVLRGGAFGSSADRLRCTFRNNEYPYNSALDMGFRVAIPGKPAEPPVEQPKKEETGMFKDFEEKGMVDVYGIYFDTGKWAIKPESLPVIDQIVTFLKDHPTIWVEIEGHTDNTGSIANNQVLSEKRAESIKAEVIKRGIDPGRVEAKGYGSSKPVADNKTAAGRTQNRRVTIKKL